MQPYVIQERVVWAWIIPHKKDTSSLLALHTQKSVAGIWSLYSRFVSSQHTTVNRLNKQSLRKPSRNLFSRCFLGSSRTLWRARRGSLASHTILRRFVGWHANPLSTLRDIPIMGIEEITWRVETNVCIEDCLAIPTKLSAYDIARQAKEHLP